MIWQFSYHTPYQPETPISVRGPLRPSDWYGCLGLIWGMIWKLPYNNFYLFSLGCHQLSSYYAAPNNGRSSNDSAIFNKVRATVAQSLHQQSLIYWASENKHRLTGEQTLSTVIVYLRRPVSNATRDQPRCHILTFNENLANVESV